MANFTAIAGVSRTIRTLLLDRLETANPAVTIAPPDIAVAGVSGSRLNLYLYQVSENGHLKNQEMPGLEDSGSRLRAPLALDLHYMFTAFANPETSPDGDLQAQQLLGDAMRVLHEFPIVDPDFLITRSAAGTVGQPILDLSLRGEFERVKLTLEPATLDEFSKIWTALPEANFRRSVAYHISVVQIESRLPRRIGPPVQTRRIHLAPMRRPQVTAVYRTPPPTGGPIGDTRAAILQEITIEGANFAAPRTWVKLGRLDPIEVTPAADSLIHLTIPDDPQLQPGPQTVEVRIQRSGDVTEGGLLDRGVTTDDLLVEGSNQGLFMLVPSITTATATATLITVNGQRLWHPSLDSVVIVGDVAIQVRRPVGADPWAQPTATSVQVPRAPLTAATPPIGPGTHLVRIVVNGAQNAEDDGTVTLP